MEEIVVGGQGLTPEQVVAVAEGRAKAVPAPTLEEQMAPARDLVRDVLETERTVYGITTGFGALATTHIGKEGAETLQYNLIRSHAAGVGDPLPDELVRAMLLLRARTLAQGHSGVRAEVPLKLLEMLERNILPVVPSQGSVGASGDLAPFAHLALPVIGEGQVRVNGQIMDTNQSGLEPLALHAKEGLSLLNGTEGMAAMGSLALSASRRLVVAADVACAMSIDALMGSSRPFDPRIHRLRPHPGQRESARRIGALLINSQIGASHADDFEHAVQDAYSLRCAPQVHGAVTDTLDHMEQVLTVELASVVDNPIVFPEEGDVVSGGNFHGQPLAFVLDFAAIAVSELASISERRTDRMLDPTRSAGLSPFLAANPGLESGYMIGQYVQAALVAENRVLAHPASIESIPTSGSQEDHVSMGWGAGRKLFPVLENVRRVLAIELLCGAQGIDLRAPLTPGEGVIAAQQLIRENVPTLSADRSPSAEIEVVADLIKDGAFDQFGL